MKKYLLSILSILTLIVFMTGFISNQNVKGPDEHPEVEWDVSCQDCHAEETPEVFKSWEASRHGTVNFGCYICHGDGEKTFYAKGTDKDCQGCHAAQVESMEKTEFKSCFKCHDGHSLKFHMN